MNVLEIRDGCLRTVLLPAKSADFATSLAHKNGLFLHKKSALLANTLLTNSHDCVFSLVEDYFLIESYKSNKSLFNKQMLLVQKWIDLHQNCSSLK
jgi:hypothetical protein